MTALDIIALLAVLQYLAIGAAVGKARGRYGIKAPATSGHEQFDRAYRVQMNTLELLVVLLPTLYIAARHLPPLWVAGAGAIYLIGRLVYWRAYLKDPASRSLGFLLSAGPIMALVLTTLMFALMRSLG